MKKSLIILALLPLLFFGCKKGGSTDEPKPMEKLYEVKFKAGLKQDIKPITARTLFASSTGQSFIDEGIKKIEFMIYDSNLKLLKSGTNNLFDVNGSIIPSSMEFKAELPKGNYIVAAVAHSDKFTLGSDTTNHNIQFTFERMGSYLIPNVKSIYTHKYSKFTVDGTVLDKNIPLNRHNSQIEINITDNIPPEVDYILFGGTVSIMVYPLRSYGSLGLDGYIKFDMNKIRNSQSRIVSNVFYPPYFSTSSTNKPSNYEVLFFSKENVLLGSKKINNVIFKENHITRLTGKLFESISNESKSTALKFEFIKEFNSDVITQTF